MERHFTVCFLVVLLAAGCLSVDTETAETPTVAAFDPAPVSLDEDHLKLPQVPQPSDLAMTLRLSLQSLRAPMLGINCAKQSRKSLFHRELLNRASRLDNRSCLA